MKVDQGTPVGETESHKQAKESEESPIYTLLLLEVPQQLML